MDCLWFLDLHGFLFGCKYGKYGKKVNVFYGIMMVNVKLGWYNIIVFIFGKLFIYFYVLKREYLHIWQLFISLINVIINFK